MLFFEVGKRETIFAFHNLEVTKIVKLSEGFWAGSFNSFKPNYSISTPPENVRRTFPAGNFMFEVNNRNTRTRCEICWKLTIKIPERRHWSCFSVFIVNFEHISHLFLVFLLLTLSWQMPAGLVFDVFRGKEMKYWVKLC